MTIYYDLGQAPPTFDFISFLLGHAMHYDDPTDLVIVPGVRGDSLWPYGQEARLAMVENVVIPLAWMLPSIRSVTLKEIADPPKTKWGHYYLMQAFRRGCRPLRAPKTAWMDRPYVTITLREADHWPERNSNLDAWITAADHIESRGYAVVFIRDTVKADEPFPLADRDAAIDLDHRASLYAGVFLNMGVNNGPMWLAAAMDTPVMIFKPISTVTKTTSSEFLAKAGMKPGELHPWGTKHQSVIWGQDTAEVIINAFDSFIGQRDISRVLMAG